MEYIDLESVLQDEQKYVLDYVGKTGADIKAVRQDVATSTCFEKADLLSWESKNIVKAVFLSIHGKVYGFVCPELGTREFPLRFDKKLVGKIFDIPSKQIKFPSRGYLPIGMEQGTCTPFVFGDSFEDYGLGRELERIFVYSSEEFDYSKVDISLGGCGEDAHKISAHLHGKDIYDCLDYVFSNRIKKFSLENI